MNFCTLFDSNYISKGIALYLSIEKYTDDFVLYVMAMDRKCEEMLTSLNFRHVEVECIDDNMSEELSAAKGNRSRAEYCWTCGSYVTHKFLTKYNLPDITYLDSDLMFFSSPQVIFDELSEKHASVGLSPHFIPYNATGKYCVQYCYFKNDKDGLAALTWWRNECLKWCYSQIEDGKYGDQMYLDKMPEMFDNVVDIENRGTGMAYWNSFAYKYTKEGVVYKGTNYPFVFYHYSGLNINWAENSVVVKECYKVTGEIRKIVIEPYVKLMSEVYSKYLGLQVDDVDYQIGYGRLKSISSSLGELLSRFDTWHKMKAKLLAIKYTKRHSPYSERKNDYPQKTHHIRKPNTFVSIR